jgi:hypothetical protein
MDARLDPTDPSLFFRLVSSRLAPDRENDADPTTPSTRLLTSIVPDRAVRNHIKIKIKIKTGVVSSRKPRR